MASTTTGRVEPRRWSVDAFAAFWANPDPARVPVALTGDVIGHWPGRDQPVRGKDEYTRCIANLVATLPDVRVTVLEHAEQGEFVFIRWAMNACGTHGPFELTGIDRVRTRDGLVCENVIVFDTAAFRARSGKEIPWT
jgi:hypothetical protein